MKRTGQTLKTTLGLDHLKYVSFIRLLGTPHRMIVIFYDSDRRNIPLTTQRVLRSTNLFSYFLYPFRSSMPFTPLIPLEDYNGELRGTMFLTFDLSGMLGKPQYQVQLEQTGQKPLYHVATFGGGLFQEFVTLADLKDPDAMSDFTKNTRSQRNRAVKPENITAKPVDCILDTVEDHVTFVLKTTATVPIYPDDFDFQKTDPDRNHQLIRNPDKEYEIYIRILGFLEWLKDTRPDDDTSAVSQKEVKEVLNVANIQVYSNSPSFHFQSMNYTLSQIGGSIYPTSIAPHRWNAPHLHGDGTAFVDKHLGGVLRSYQFFLGPFASMLTKKLKDRGII